MLVCSIQREPIPGTLRYAWMKKLFHGGNVRVIHIDVEVPQEPAEHPEFWSIWEALIRHHVPEPIDAVFTSEDYGQQLANVLHATHFPVDPHRQIVPISGTDIRRDPMTHWPYLPDVVRPYFVKRVCVFGPESTGKSTLSRDLAAHYQTTFAPEYARTLLDPKQGQCDAADVAGIVFGQIASEEAASRHANRVVLCDTDPFTTSVWCDVMFGHCPDWVHQAAARQRYDLTLLMDIDVPWVDDAQRSLPNRREEFLGLCVKALDRAGRSYTKISGTWEQRKQRAGVQIDQLLLPPHKPDFVLISSNQAEAKHEADRAKTINATRFGPATYSV